MIATPGTLIPRPRSKCVSTAQLLVDFWYLTERRADVPYHDG